ncbi:hypothetical protein ACQYE5_000693 [Enterobacter cancerogenus]
MRTTKVKIYSRYNVPQHAGVLFELPTRTQQHFADEVDINQIVARAISTGNHALFTPQQRQEFYDATFFTDYMDALSVLDDVRDDFSSLPSSVRKEFGHDPDKYVAFMSNPQNMHKAVEMGLLQGVEKPKPPVSVSGTSDPSGDPPEAVLPKSDA